MQQQVLLYKVVELASNNGKLFSKSELFVKDLRYDVD